MNYENIRAFIEVTSCGSFQRAAQNLHITQSAMSARIKTLEDRLNRQLFIRSRNGASLTSGGQIFAQHAIAMMQHWERACNEVMLPELHTKVVSLGIQTNHWQQIGLPWQHWMKEKSSEIAIQIRIDHSNLLVDSLSKGIIDLAIVYDSQNRLGVSFEEFSSHELVLVSTIDRQVERGIVDNYVYIDWGRSFQNLHNQYYPHAPYHHLEFADADKAFKYMLDHGGSGYFIKQSVQSYIDNKALFLVNNAPNILIKTFLMCSTEKKNSPEIQQAITGLKAIK